MTTETDQDLIQVTVRTAETGHVTIALALDALPAFIDRHLADGRAVIAESGDESLLIRVGREILDFFRGRRKAGATKPKEKLTVTNPMRGGAPGQDDPVETPPSNGYERVLRQAAGAPRQEATQESAGEQLGRPVAAVAAVDIRILHEIMAATLRASVQGGQDYRNGPPQPAPGGPERTTNSRPLDLAAEMRAWQGLVDAEGEAAALSLVRNGAIAVESALWPRVYYLVTTSTIKVLREGHIVTALCLQPADGASIWDAVATRLSLLRAGATGEIQVWTQAFQTHP